MRMRDLLTLVEDLDHGKRLLFHGTTLMRAVDILATDCLRGNTTDTAGAVRTMMKGISLTRSYAFAQTHRGTSRSIVFVLDMTHLKTQPVAYWSPAERKRFAKADEMEEFFIGNIAPLSKYLVSINSKVAFETWLARIAEMTQSEDWEKYTDPAVKTAVKKSLDNGFPQARALWNRWTPVKGV